MKKYICILILFSFYCNINAQKKNSAQDSIKVFYDKVFYTMERGYINKASVKWKELEPRIRESSKKYKTFQASLKEVPTLFNDMNADHMVVFYNNAEFAGKFAGITKNDFSEQWLKRYSTKPKFEVKVFNGDIGYILMPEINIIEGNSELLHAAAQPMYEEINKIKNSTNIKGWILDLRFNTGGNCTPMLLALYDFLGNNDVWGHVDFNNKYQSVKLDDGKYISGSKKVSYINPKGELLDNAKVAVLTNLATGSSGEVTALSFKGRENTIFIGERSNGKTSTNILVDLPFGAKMTLTIGYDTDRNRKVYDYLIPDIQIIKQDDFDNPLEDKNIKEAIKFISA